MQSPGNFPEWTKQECGRNRTWLRSQAIPDVEQYDGGKWRQEIPYFKHNSGKRLLRLALGSKASTIEAFAERLFVAAIRSEDIEIVHMLLSYGVDPSRWSYLDTPLICVIQGGNSELAQLLIHFGADVNAPPAGGYCQTALQAAAEKGNIELVRILLHAGADVNAPPAEDSGATALQICVISGFFEIAIVLLDAGADVNALGSCINGRCKVKKESLLKLHCRRAGLNMSLLYLDSR
jgi:hypothetical protein